jgi:hypothetical protein
VFISSVLTLDGYIQKGKHVASAPRSGIVGTVLRIQLHDCMGSAPRSASSGTPNLAEKQSETGTATGTTNDTSQKVQTYQCNCADVASVISRVSPTLTLSASAVRFCHSIDFEPVARHREHFPR